MRWILFAIVLPWTLVLGYPWVLFFAVFAAKGLRFEKGGVLTAVWRDWVVRPRKSGRPIWRYSTTLGRGIIYQPDRRRARLEDPLTGTERHELVHIRQVEDRMTLSLLVGLAVFLGVGIVSGDWTFGALFGLGVWTSGGAWQLPNMLAGAFRYGFNSEGLYFSTEHERSARAQTSSWAGGGRRWEDYDDELRARGRKI